METKVKPLEEIFETEEEITIARNLLKNTPKDIEEYPYTKANVLSIIENSEYSLKERRKCWGILEKLEKARYIECRGVMGADPLYKSSEVP